MIDKKIFILIPGTGNSLNMNINVVEPLQELFAQARFEENTGS